jgi:hypothetical protein
MSLPAFVIGVLFATIMIAYQKGTMEVGNIASSAIIIALGAIVWLIIQRRRK